MAVKKGMALFKMATDFLLLLSDFEAQCLTALHP